MSTKKEKRVKRSVVSSDGIPLSSCTEAEWQKANPAYAPDQLNVKKSKKRVTVFTTKSPKPKSLSHESVRSLDDTTVLSGEAVESGSGTKQLHRNTSNSSSYLTAQSVDQDAALIHPNEKVVGSDGAPNKVKANETRNA
ncbi:hypothetical protein M3Y96_01154300 [Aphelenchoides besseyi]|nr:hypothetical protein M3Y96_01154300 [Aphelenchoides besseyi]